MIADNKAFRRRGALGFTLIEVLVVVAIVGILVAIGYPSYMQYVTRTKRTTAKSVLLQVADRQEQFFGDNKAYAATLVQLGYGANPFMIDDDGAQVPAGNVSRIYSIALNRPTATTFTATAAPQLVQATRDAKCASLTLTNNGQRGQTGTSTDCW
jgi:type IV pilus assembly protein PilE